MNVQEIISIWKDEKEVHKYIAETFHHKTNEVQILKDYRDWIESNSFGHGERCFYWMWKLLIDELPKEFTFLEIGVHRGQILGLVRMLSDMAGKRVLRYGISPMDGTELNIPSDYYKDVERIHELFLIEKDYVIIEGLSTDRKVIEATEFMSLDIVYIDGGHDYETVKQDIVNYMPLVKKDGFLVMDDACNDMALPDGYFFGMESVTKAVNELLPNYSFEFLFNVGHNKVYRRK